MKNKMYLWAGIVGGIAYFLLGWIVYGMLLMSFMQQHTPLSAEVMKMVNKSPEEFTWWAMILSNLTSGFLLATVFSWANISSAAAGARTGAIFAFLMAMSFDFIMFGTTHMMSLKAVAADICAWTAINIVVGAIVGWLMGKGANKAAAA